MFRETEKRLKETPGGSLYEYEKVINVYSITFSCFFENKKEQRLGSECPELESWCINSRMIIKG
jgi:hypothetical protein